MSSENKSEDVGVEENVEVEEENVEGEDEVNEEEEDEDGVEGAEPLEEEEEEEEEEDEEEEEPTVEDEDGVEGAEPLEEPLKKRTTREKKSKVSRTLVTGVEMLEATKNTQFMNASLEEESDEEPEEDEQYLQKFDSEMRDNFILNYHPESRTHNYEEVKALARVTRDARGIIVDPLHKTLPFLTKYEMTRVLGQRAKQLDYGAKPFVKIPLNVLDGYHIAKLELEQKKIPFIIKRPFPNGGIEYWHVNDLEVF